MFSHPDIHFARLIENPTADGHQRVLLLETDVSLAPAHKLHRDERSESLVGYLDYLHRLTDQGFIACDVIAIRDGQGRTYIQCKDNDLQDFTLDANQP